MNEKKIAIKTRDMERLREWLDHLRTHPRLTFLFVELTRRCNLACLHCGSRCDGSQALTLDFDLLVTTLGTVAEDFDPKSVMICLTGGEPLLYPHFWPLVKKITELGFPWGMTTNGTLIDSEQAARLRHSGIASVTVSIDGLKEAHERLRRVPGCYGLTIQGVRALNQVGVPVQVTSVIHRDNYSELEALYDLMKSLEVVSWRVINLDPIGRARDHLDLLLTREQFYGLLDYVRKKRYDTWTPFDVRYGCAHYLSFEYEREVRDNYFICGSGIYVASILSNGDIFSCLDIERRDALIQGNIRTDRFSDVWYNRFGVFREDRTQRCDECLACAERGYCRGDATHTWDFDRNAPMLCALREHW